MYSCVILVVIEPEEKDEVQEAPVSSPSVASSTTRPATTITQHVARVETPEPDIDWAQHNLEWRARKLSESIINELPDVPTHAPTIAKRGRGRPRKTEK